MLVSIQGIFFGTRTCNRELVVILTVGVYKDCRKGFYGDEEDHTDAQVAEPLPILVDNVIASLFSLISINTKTSVATASICNLFFLAMHEQSTLVVVEGLWH